MLKVLQVSLKCHMLKEILFVPAVNLLVLTECLLLLFDQVRGFSLNTSCQGSALSSHDDFVKTNDGL